MKKYIIPFLTALLAMSLFDASAQAEQMQKYYDYLEAHRKPASDKNTYEQKNVVSYIKASASINRFAMGNTLIGNLDGYNIFDVSHNPVVGYNVMAGFQYRLVKNLGLYLGSEIGIGTRGVQTQFSSKPVLSTDPEVILSKRYFNHAVKLTPLQIGYRFNITYSFCIDPHIGGYVSYDLAGKEAVTILTGYSNNTKETNIREDEGFNRFDAGINPGVTLWLGPFGLDFTYQRGFINANKEKSNPAKAYTENFIVGLAFRF